MTHRSRSIVPVVLAVGLAAAPLLLQAAADVKAHMKARHDHYEQLGDAFKTIGDGVKKREPDWGALEKAARKVNDASVDQGRWFPAGTGPEAGKTRALPEIWKAPQAFTAAQQRFSDAAPKLLAAVQTREVGPVRKQFESTGQACKNCHDRFRSKEEHH